MHIPTGNLQGRPRSIKFSEAVEKFPALVVLAEQGEVVFRGEVVANLKASLVDGMVRVEGHVAAEVTLTCSRCLEPVEHLVDVLLSLCYSELDPRESAGDVEEMEELDPRESAGDVEEMELTLKDLDLIPYQGDEINLGPEIAHELIMALPQTVLCREDCLGLCPVCGIDLNKNTCQCEPPVFHEGLARLKNFKAKRD
jgi:uncharacterized protein